MGRIDSPRFLLRPRALAALALLSVAFPVPLLAVVYTVGPHGAYGTIQSALNASLDGETTDIRVEGGFTYSENLLVPSTFDEVRIVLTGGWNSAFSARAEDPAVTVIDGGGSRVLDVRLKGVSFSMDGFKITNGGAEKGAGIYVLPNGNADIEISNVHIIGNTATSAGQATGGGLRAELEGTERLELWGCRIRGNTAISTGGAQAKGGGLFIYAGDSASFRVQHCEIDENTIESAGGALMGGGINLIVAGSAQGEILDSYPVDNTAVGTNGYASGAHFETSVSGVLTIERSGFILNTVSGGGTAPQFRSTSTDTSSLLIRDSGIAQGDYVGMTSFAFDSAIVNMVNLTVADNDTNGIYLSQSGSSTVTLYNSIAFESGPNLTTIGTVDTGSNLIGIDPLFVDPTALDYHLRSGSPAIDSGDNSPPGGLGSADFDGNPRIENGVVDIGMYEGISEIFADGFESGDTSTWSSTVQ